MLRLRTRVVPTYKFVGPSAQASSTERVRQAARFGAVLDPPTGGRYGITAPVKPSRAAEPIRLGSLGRGPIRLPFTAMKKPYGGGSGMQRNIALIAFAVIGVSALIGSAAFTSGTIDRAATIKVAGDDAAIVGLAPGNSGQVSYDGNNELTIDFPNVNADANYTIGNGDSANTTYAFNITNNDATAHDISLSYAYNDAANITGSPVTFDLYDSQGVLVSGGTTSLDANGAEVAYVVITINTHGLTNGADLSGTLTVKAN